MAQVDFFGIRRPADDRRRISVTIDDEAVRGLAIMRSTTEPDKGVAATGELLGFLLRDVTEDGPTTEQRAGVWGKELELPWVAGGECTLEPPPDAFEVEGDAYCLLSGTGQVDATTTIGTQISFVSGKIRVAQEGDDALYRVGDNSALDGTTLTEDGDGPRFLLEKIS